MNEAKLFASLGREKNYSEAEIFEGLGGGKTKSLKIRILTIAKERKSLAEPAQKVVGERKIAIEILKYLLLMIGGTVVCASAFPFCEYLYHRFVNKETYNICYYFSQELFDIHLNQYDIHPSLMCRVINNREELADMWEKELKKKLP